MSVRMVVTGHDAGGKAVFVSDEKVEPVRPPLRPGSEFYRLWGGDEPPHFPDDGAMPTHVNYFPPVGGFRFGVTRLPADQGGGERPDLDGATARAELEELLPGLTQYMEPDSPGVHTTPTVDFLVVLSGEVILEVDDGAAVHLSAGDTVVQNGTRHRWSNPGSEPAWLAVTMCGAHHDQIS